MSGDTLGALWTVDKSITTKRYDALRAVLKQARKDAGLSQGEVARLLDEPQSFVSKYESGVRRLDLVELEQVAEALGLTLRDLVGRYEAAVR
jgi:transcriptional regulator with XRE-family HTH domain